ncbi:MAG: GHKL domain-containing protein [Paramuribaculum sp.]|nr:GHKL domain-containing protein [Paramuribaculum sp.]
MIRFCFLLIGLIASIVVTTLFIIHEEYVAAAISFLAFIFLFTGIIRFSIRSDKDLGIILDAVRNGDTTLHFNNISYPGKIGEKLNRISQTLHATRLAIVRNQTYYSLILNKVPSGVFVADSKGKILTINDSCLNMLEMEALGSLARLSESYPGASKTIMSLRSGDTATITLADRTVAVSCNQIMIPDKGELRVFVMTRIDAELNKKETDSWTMSVRTLAHEIMNSVTPIISISKTLSSIAKEEGENPDIKEGLDTISTMGEELMQFARNYRALAHSPHPQMHEEDLGHIVTEIVAAAKQQPNNEYIAFNCTDTWYQVICDRNLTYTAISNIVRNSIEALQGVENGEITINCFQTKQGDIQLNISNNGEHIPEEINKEIFSPFFTTKSDGQGIGLPLSKRIMVAQHGNLYLRPYSNPDSLTTFTFLFSSTSHT